MVETWKLKVKFVCKICGYDLVCEGGEGYCTKCDRKVSLLILCKEEG